MLGGGFLNSRLATRIRVKDGLSYGVGSSLSAKSHEKDGQYEAFAIAAPQNVAKVEAAFKEEIARALKDGFTQKEMDDDRHGWLQSQQVNRAEDGWLVRALTTRDYDSRTMAFDADLEKKVAALTPDDVVQALRRHIDLARFSIVKAGDFKSLGTAK
jgi:zinc protease